MSIFRTLEDTLTSYADKVPVEIFSFAGSFIEEVIAPIPSPIVMTVTGSIAEAQGKPLMYLIILAILGACGKTLGALILYFLADKGEDFILSKFGRFLGVTNKEITAIGKHISGSWKDIFILTLVRSLPILPSAPISVVCGMLKVRKGIFAAATFFGTIIRDSVYLYVGYSGLQVLNSIVSGLNSVESLMQGLIVLVLILFFGYMYHKKSKGNALESLKKLFDR